MSGEASPHVGFEYGPEVELAGRSAPPPQQRPRHGSLSPVQRPRHGSLSPTPPAKHARKLSLELADSNLTLPEQSDGGPPAPPGKKERPRSGLFPRPGGSFKFTLGKRSKSDKGRGLENERNTLMAPEADEAAQAVQLEEAAQGKRVSISEQAMVPPPPHQLAPEDSFMMGVEAPSPRAQGKIGLLLMNVQMDFVAKKGALRVKDIPKDYADKLNHLASLTDWKLRMVAASQHPPNYAYFHGNAPGTTPFEDSQHDTLIVPDHCVLGSWGAQLLPDLDVSMHQVVVETGTVPEPEDASAFGTQGANSHESIAEQYVSAAQVTDMVIAGVDIDGENFLSTVFALSEQYVNVIIIKDLCFSVVASEELWPSLEELGAQIETLESITPFLKKFRDNNPGSLFSEKRFQELMAFTRGSNPDLDALRSIVQQKEYEPELTTGHPMTGWYFVHYLSACTTKAAAIVLTELLDTGVVDIDQHSDIDDITPIMAALRNTAVETAEVLLRNVSQGGKLRLARADCYGRTALMHAIQTRSTELVKLLMESSKGGKRLLHARDSALRSVLSLACIYAGKEPQDMHPGGSDVLDLLWPQFEGKEFTDGEGDLAGWTFWNFAVRYNLTKHLTSAFTKFTLSTQQQRAIQEQEDAQQAENDPRILSPTGRSHFTIREAGLTDPVLVVEQKRFQDHARASVAGGGKTTGIMGMERTVTLNAVLQLQGHDPHATPGTLAKHMSKAPERWEQDRLRAKGQAGKGGQRRAAGGVQVPLATVLTRTGLRGQNLLHQATWQRKTDLLPQLLDYYQEESLLHEVNESGLSALDLVAHDINPVLPFMLVEGGCVSKQTSGAPMYQLCLKALMLGHVRVFRDMVVSGSYGVKVDSPLLDTLTRLAVLRACTATTPGSIYQLAFHCSDCSRADSNNTLVCFSCALACHGSHKGLRSEGMQSFHCTHPKEKCKCQRGNTSLDSLYQTVQLLTAHVLMQPDQVMGVELSTHRSGYRRSLRLSGLDLESMQPADTNRALLNKMKSFKSQRKVVGDSFRSKYTEQSAMTPQASSRSLPHSRWQTQAQEQDVVLSDQADDNFSLAQQKLSQLTGKLTYREMLFHILLMSVARTGQEAMVDELVKKVKPDYAVDESLDRPLHVAARNGRAAICALLRSNGARLNSINLIGETPMHLAAQYGHLNVCLVVAHGSNLLRMDTLALTPLHHAVRNNRPDVVDYVCKFLRYKAKVPVDIDDLVLPVRSTAPPPPSAGRSRKNSLGIGLAAKKQTQARAIDTSCVNPAVMVLGPGQCEGHATPLHLAVRYGHAQCVKTLMKHGASPINVDATGFNPYQTAIWELYITRFKLEQHQMLLSLSSPSGGATSVSTSKSGPRKRSQSTLSKKRFRASEVSDIEAQMRDLNSNVPVQYRTLGLRTTQTILDTMGQSPSVERLRKRFAYRKLVSQVSAYLLVLLLFIAFSVPRTSTNYFFARRLADRVERSGWQNVTSLEQSWAWVDANLNSSVALLDPTTGDDPFVGVHLLGSVRLRQVRSRVRMCDGPSYVSGVPDHSPCLPASMTPAHELHELLSWNPVVSGPDSVYDAVLQRARQWQSAGTPSTTFDLGQYSGDGYWVDLDLVANDEDYNARLLDLLQAQDDAGRSWIDVGTRLIQVEFAVYNLNLNVFGVALLSLEHDSAGELTPNSEILSYELERDMFDTYPSLGFKVASGLVALFLGFNILVAIVRKGLWKSLGTLACWFDFALASLAASVLGMDVWVSSRVHDSNIDVEDTARFQSLLEIVRWISSEGFVISVLILVLWLRLIKYSVLMPKFGRVTFAFMNTIKNFEVVSYLLFMLFVVVGFVMGYRIAFNQTEKTSTYEGGFNLLTQMMMGEWNEEVFVTLPFVMRTVMYISFMITVAVIFINLFISVLSEVYPREKKRAMVQCNDNLTVLIEREFIFNTHSFRRIANPRSSERLRRLVRNYVVSPLITNASVILRLFDTDWNLDVPKKEFGWERGRDVFRRNLVADVAGMEEEGNERA